MCAVTDEEESEAMQTVCRGYILPRDHEALRARGWIRGNTKIGQVLDVKVFPHQARYCIDIMIEPLFRDQTVSWVSIVNGINKFVTETSQEFPVGSVQLVRTGELVAKAKPRPMPTGTLSTVSVPDRHRSSTIQ